MPRVLILPLQRRAYDLWADRTRVPELDEKPVQVQPLPADLPERFCIVQIVGNAI